MYIYCKYHVLNWSWWHIFSGSEASNVDKVADLRESTSIASTASTSSTTSTSSTASTASSSSTSATGSGTGRADAGGNHWHDAQLGASSDGHHRRHPRDDSCSSFSRILQSERNAAREIWWTCCGMEAAWDRDFISVSRRIKWDFFGVLWGSVGESSCWMVSQSHKWLTCHYIFSFFDIIYSYKSFIHELFVCKYIYIPL